jgi:two-component system, NtrC family, sensor kinase
MLLQTLAIVFIIRNLQKTLQTKSLLPQWNKTLVTVLTASIVLFIINVSNFDKINISTWLSHAILFWLVYITFYIKEFHPAKQLIYTVLPIIIISFLSDLVELINQKFYQEWDSYFETAAFFALIWMVAMWVTQKKQRNALEKEKRRTAEIEKENKITERLKAELEVQVAERTLALTQQKEELQHALDDLKSTQAQLIQSEKMASLGELTAGIAHEIQNPLNFVNNFSEVNSELITEMKEELHKGNIEGAIAIAGDINDNEQKIIFHGKRADAIVKGMLQHSRSSSGVKEPSDINELADEYLRLAYHGLRAKDKAFNATMKTDFDESIGNINIVPQDIGRVILNLITNAFYAVTEKKESLSSAGQKYEPTVTVSTKKKGNKIEITVGDNGNGIPQKALDKIFQPFFTTKPTGKGTGLGLSMSYDIITKGHDGEIKVETKEGEGTVFKIILPV